MISVIALPVGRFVITARNGVEYPSSMCDCEAPTLPFTQPLLPPKSLQSFGVAAAPFRHWSRLTADGAAARVAADGMTTSAAMHAAIAVRPVRPRGPKIVLDMYPS